MPRYDLDGDGKAEIACKTADGTIDGTGAIIGNGNVDYRTYGVKPGKGTTYGLVLDGPEFLTIFNGKTGAAMDTIDYDPQRGGNGSSWGDSYGNRANRFLAAIAYLDGQRPSLMTTQLLVIVLTMLFGEVSAPIVFDNFSFLYYHIKYFLTVKAFPSHFVFFILPKIKG